MFKSNLKEPLNLEIEERASRNELKVQLSNTNQSNCEYQEESFSEERVGVSNDISNANLNNPAN